MKIIRGIVSAILAIPMLILAAILVFGIIVYSDVRYFICDGGVEP